MITLDNKNALDQIFDISNGELSVMLKVPYQTVASWRFKHSRNDLSIEKQIEIISKMNYQMENTISWKKLQK